MLFGKFLVSLSFATCSLIDIASAKTYVLGKKVNESSVAIYEADYKIDPKNPDVEPLYFVTMDHPIVDQMLKAEKRFNDVVAESGLSARDWLKRRDLQMNEFTPLGGSVLQKRCSKKPAKSCADAVVCSGAGQKAPCSTCPDLCRCFHFEHSGGGTNCCISEWYCAK